MFLQSLVSVVSLPSHSADFGMVFFVFVSFTAFSDS